jgi:hypothetical protein
MESRSQYRLPPEPAVNHISDEEIWLRPITVSEGERSSEIIPDAA